MEWGKKKKNFTLLFPLAPKEEKKEKKKKEWGRFGKKGVFFVVVF